MCLQNSSHFVKGVAIAIWTIVQTSFHIVFVLGGYYICQFKPSNYLMIVFYITYFYNYDECGSQFVKKVNSTLELIDLNTNATEDEDHIDRIVHTIMETAIFPRATSPYIRTQFYLSVYIIFDGCLILSGFLLFAGVSFQVKKCLSTLFYGPWLLLTAVSVILDVVIAVHYGLDMLEIHNYTSWLKFIGVSNYKDFTKFNTYASSSYVPHMSSVTMALFFSRFIAFWVLNIVNFFTIVTNFLLAYRGSDGVDKNSQHLGKRSKHTRHAPMNSSETRIRNWQMFYGNVETNSIGSSSSIKSDFNSPRGVNMRMSTTKRRPSNDSPNPVAGNSTTRYSLDSNDEFLSSAHSSPKITNSYIKYPDVVEGMETNNNMRKGSTDSVRREVPWSYLRKETPPSILGNFKDNANVNSRDKFAQGVDDRPGSTAL